MAINNRSWTASAVLLGLVAVVLLLSSGATAQTNYKTLSEFTGGAAFPSGLVIDQTGDLYGEASAGGGGSFLCHVGCGFVYKLTPNSNGNWTKAVLYSFCSLKNCADGFQPTGGLIFDQSGNLYGETYMGGGPVGCDCGVVFELIPNSGGSWTEKVLHHFKDGADGGLPFGGLIFDQAGNLYGTTNTGGLGRGVIFRLTPGADGSWTEKALHTFPNPVTVEGGNPAGGVVFDQAGNLYGETVFGGDLSRCGGSGSGCGLIFELIPNANGGWSEKVLHRFGGGDGAFPSASVVFDQLGNLYATTSTGGNPTQCPGLGFGCGVVFRLRPNADGSWTEKVLHYFIGGKDGSQPLATVVFDQTGSLYGTTRFGGNLSYCTSAVQPNGCGVVFKLVQNLKGEWSETVEHDFLDRPGAHPEAGVIFDAIGNLYGTTTGDYTTTFGSVFEIRP